ncbi:MAG TPA: M3 family oligoendopeptidase [Ktedonobacterales bacterium]
MPDATTLPPRASVPPEQTWDLASVYPTDAAWEAALREAEAALPTLARFQGRLGESPATLLDALRARDRWVTTAWRLRLYPNMQVKTDATDADAAARLQQAESLRGRLFAALAYIEPELLSLPPDQLDSYLASSADLAVYTHYVAMLRRRAAHVAAPAVEALLAAAAPLAATPYATYQALVNGELRCAPARDTAGTLHPVAPSTIDALLLHADPTLRQSAWESFADGYLAHRHTLAQLLAGAFQANILAARARGYPSALDAALDAALLPRAVYTTLLDTYQRHLPLWHRYWELRRRLLDLDSLTPADTGAPLDSRRRGNPESTRADFVANGPSEGTVAVLTAGSIPYDTARALILAAVAPLGPDYAAILRRGLYDERWVDYAKNQGKLGGAEQSGAYGTHPFVLLTWEGTLISVSALAHELGHAMHAYYTWHTQPPIYEEFTDWLAETASTCHQALLRAHLARAEPNDRALQLASLSEAFAYYERYLFLMPMLSRLEWEGHQRLERGEGLGADWLSARTLELLREGYGPAVSLADADRAGILWAQFPHLYLNFYTYQYSLGIAAANRLSAAIQREGAPAAARYTTLLRAGASIPPLDALRAAGVDLTTAAPVEAAFATLSGLLDRLEALLPS